MPTPDRFENAERCLADCRPLQAGAALTRHQALYVNHLRIARHLETWARSMDQAQGPLVRDAKDQGFAAGLRAVATHLRRGTYVYLPESDSDRSESSEPTTRTG